MKCGQKFSNNTARFFPPVLCFLLYGFSAAADSHISEFKFSTEPQSILPNAVSETIIVQAKNAAGEPVKAGKTACLKLSSSSAGEFSSSSENWNSVAVLTMASNWTSRSFYYRSSAPGVHALAAKIALRPDDEVRSCAAWPYEEWSVQWTATQSITVRGETPSLVGASSSVSAAPAPAAAAFLPLPKIQADAGEDKTAAAGSNIEFLGMAYGVKGEPMEQARFWWNFGDGDAKEGRAVSHIFQVPGTYTVGLHISSGSYAASDYAAVSVVPNQLKISRVIPGERGFVQLANPGETEIDLGGWILDEGAKQFALPPRTKIAKGSEIAFPNSLTGLGNAPGAALSIRYPNSAFVLRYVAQPPPAIPEKTVGDIPEKKTAAPAEIVARPPLPQSISRGSTGSTDSASSPQANLLQATGQDNPSVAATASSVLSANASGARTGSGFIFILGLLISIAASAAFLVFKNFKRWKNPEF